MINELRETLLAFKQEHSLTWNEFLGLLFDTLGWLYKIGEVEEE